MSRLILQTLTVQNFKRFVAPLTLRFHEGANLIHGPNESGKSTLVEALEAVLFYRARSGATADALRSRGGEGWPEVTLDFQIDEHPYRIHKLFRSTRGDVELTDQESRQAWSGDEALERIWRLLHVNPPAGKAQFGNYSALEQYGRCWPLLWVQQGGARQLLKPSSNAKGDLTESFAGLVDTTLEFGPGVEAISNAINAGLEQFFTPGGQPLTRADAPLHQARQNADTLRAQRNERQARVARYEDWRNQAVVLRTALDKGRAELETLDQQVQQLSGQVERASGFEVQVERQNAFVLEQEGLLNEALRREEERQRRGRERTRQEAASTEARTRLDQASRRRGELEAAAATQQTASQEAHEALAEATRLADRWTQRRRLTHAIHEVARLDKLTADLATLQEELDTVEGQREALSAFTAEELERLRGLERQARDARTRFEAVQARWTLTALGSPVEVVVDDTPLTVSVTAPLTRIIQQPTRLRLGDLAELEIQPGETDWSELQAAATQHAEAYDQALGQRQVTDLAEAEARHLDWRAAAGRYDDRKQQVARLLQREGYASAAVVAEKLTAARQEQASSQALFDNRTHPGDPDLPADDTAIETGLAAATAALEAARSTANLASSEETATRRVLAEARRQEQEANDGLAKATDALELAQRAVAEHIAQEGSGEALTQAIADATAKVAEAKQVREDSVGQFATALGVARPADPDPRQQMTYLRDCLDRLKKECDRQRESLKAQRQNRQDKEAEHSELIARLKAAEVIGLPEEIAQLDEQLAVAEAEVARLTLEGDAWRLLAVELEAHRKQAEEAAQQPLVEQFARLVRPWHRGATINVEDDFSLAALYRDGQPDKFTQLSAGAREQVNTILRLAMAQLLARRQPVCLVLDEALESTDRERFPMMTSILSAAAQEMQILLFTWDSSRYADMGLLPEQKQDLTALVRAQRPA